MRESKYKLIFILIIALFIFFSIKVLLDQQNSNTEIIFFGANKADSMLIKSKNTVIMIDTGLKNDSKRLGDKLKGLGIKKIDYLILTHPDKDHIGGASHIIDIFTVDTLIMSKLDNNSKAEARIKNSLESKTVNKIILLNDMKIELDNLTITIFAPKKSAYELDNDYSLVTLINDRNLNYLFAADAQVELLSELFEKDLPIIEIYKVPHHGKDNEMTKKMIGKILPKHAIITNNVEHLATVNALKAVGSEIYYVFDQDLHITSNGKTIKIR